jgi:hypothetical protein
MVKIDITTEADIERLKGIMELILKAASMGASLQYTPPLDILLQCIEDLCLEVSNLLEQGCQAHGKLNPEVIEKQDQADALGNTLHLKIPFENHIRMDPYLATMFGNLAEYIDKVRQGNTFFSSRYLNSFLENLEEEEELEGEKTWNEFIRRFNPFRKQFYREEREYAKRNLVKLQGKVQRLQTALNFDILKKVRFFGRKVRFRAKTGLYTRTADQPQYS